MRFERGAIDIAIDYRHIASMAPHSLRTRLAVSQDAAGVARPIAETVAMVALSTLAGLFLAPRWGTSAVDLLYLPAVLFAAGLYGLRLGILAAVGSALSFNYFFTQPIHTLQVASPQDLATIAMLFLVALVTSQLAARMRAEARAARRSADDDSAIAGFARRLLSAADPDDVARSACREFAQLFDCNAILLLGATEPVIAAASPPHAVLTPSDLAAASWSLQSGKQAGRGTANADSGEWTFHPVWTDDQVLAVVGLARDDGMPVIAADRKNLLDSLLDQLALALERGRLEREATAAAEVQERGRVRSALLATIGQDIGPRLTVMGSAINQLKRAGGAEKASLAALAAEHGKVQAYMANLLDLGPDEEQQPVRVGGVSIDLARRNVTRAGVAVHLTPKEYAVLAELAKYPDRVLSHAHLLKTAWGPAQEKQIEYLRVAIRALRQKLEADPAHPALIINEPAVGYRLRG